MKIRTAAQLSDELDQELAWRKRELFTFKLLASSSREHQAETLRRAGLALLYAHWEGFVKAAGTAYVQLVANQRRSHRELSPNFLALAIKRELHNAQTTTKASLFTAVARYFVERIDERARILWDGSIQTKANLSEERLREIIATLGLDYRPFELKGRTVVERLREARNNIAHGRFLSIDAAEFDRLYNEVLALIEEYRNQIDTAAQLRRYIR